MIKNIYLLISLITITALCINSASLSRDGFYIYTDKNSLIIEPVGKISVMQTVPNDPFYNYQRFLKKLNIEKVWNYTQGSEEIYVGIIDTGIDINNPDLKDNIWKNEDEICDDGIDNDSNGYIDDCYGWDAIEYRGSALDQNGHGTATASIIGAIGNNFIGIAGINWKIKLIPCRALDEKGEGISLSAIDCIQYFLDLKMKKNLNIIAVNASFGGEYECFRYINGKKVNNQCREKDLIEELLKNDILFITSAGNYGKNNDKKNLLPCNYKLKNEICVGSINFDGKKSSFSNYGSSVNLYTYGEKIFTLSKNNNCNYGSGTSFSTAIVTAAVALLKSYYPQMPLLEIKDRIIHSGRNNLNLVGYSSTCNILDIKSALEGKENLSICISHREISLAPYSTGKIYIQNSGSKKAKITDIYILDTDKVIVSKDTCSNRYIFPKEECTVELKVIDSFIGLDYGKLYINGDISFKVNIILTNKTNNTDTANNKNYPSTEIEPLSFKCVYDQSDLDTRTEKNSYGCSFARLENSYKLLPLLFVWIYFLIKLLIFSRRS